MKTSPRSHRTKRTPAAERARLLAAFDRSGLSSAAFALKHGLHYTTFCAWRHQRAKLKPSPADALIVELGGGARLRIESAGRVALAAQLLQHLNAARPC